MKFLNKKWFCLLFVLVMLQTVSGMHPNVGLDEVSYDLINFNQNSV